MLSENKLKREIVKYIRDKAKSKYRIGEVCEICGTDKDLEFHHYNTFSRVLESWMRKNNKKAEDVLLWREEFIGAHIKELYEETVTLCRFHHQSDLHKIYGKTPDLSTASKQKRWVQIKKEKYESAK